MSNFPFGCTACDLSSGARYVVIHYTADPGKREPGYAVRTRAEMGRREFEREMEMREDLYDGQPVYRDYNDAVHCPAVIRNEFLPIVPGSQYIGGWDCGQTLQPAFVLLQVTPRPHQVHALLEVVSEGGEAMETFAQRVLQRLLEWHPALWSDVNHFGDQTVDTRNGATGETAGEVARRHGIDIRPVSNQWAGRYSAVTWLLRDMIEEDTPRFFISGKGCPVLRQGFLGAYKYEHSASGDTMGPGQVLLRPLKNAWSHVHDALQAAAVRTQRQFEAKGSFKTTRRR